MGKKKVMLAKDNESGREVHPLSSDSSSSSGGLSRSSNGGVNSWAVLDEHHLGDRSNAFVRQADSSFSPRSGAQIMTPNMMASDGGNTSLHSSGNRGGDGPISQMMRSPRENTFGHPITLNSGAVTPRLGDNGGGNGSNTGFRDQHISREGREPLAMTSNDLNDDGMVPSAPPPGGGNFGDSMDEVQPPPTDGGDENRAMVSSLGTDNGGSLSQIDAPPSTGNLEAEGFARVQPQPEPVVAPLLRTASSRDSNGGAASNVSNPAPRLAEMDLGSSIKSVSSDTFENNDGEDGDKNESEEVCFICMEGFNMNPRWTLECQCQMGISNPISVHARCIRKWKLCGKNSLCPLCRQPLPDTNVLSFQIPESLSSSLRFQKFIRASQRNILESTDFNTMIPRIVNSWMHEHPFPPQEASKEEVVDLLVQTGLQKYADNFFSEEINGQILGTFEREDLVDLGVENEGDIDRFMAVLKVLKGNSVCVHGMMM